MQSPALLRLIIVRAVTLINVHDELHEMDCGFIPDSLFAEEEGVSCWACLPAWALVEYVSSVESSEATGTNDKRSSPVEIP